MPKIKRFCNKSTPDEIRLAIESDGAVIVENILNTASLEQLKSEIMPYVLATSNGQDEFSGNKTTRTGALVSRSAMCRKMVMNPTILNAAKMFLEPYSAKIQLHLTQLIRIKPGQKKQLLHRDRLAWGGYLPSTLEPQLNSIWAVSDFTKANGATQVVPQSNHWDPKREVLANEIQYAEMKAGSVLVYSGSVIHGGGENDCTTERMGLNTGYSLAWLRQEENQFLSCPPEIAKDFEADLRVLLGYTMGSFALGYFTPPLPPGKGPEITSPEYLFGIDNRGGIDMYQESVKRAKEGGL